MTAAPPPTDRHVYTGMFADEAGQQLLLNSMAQLDATLGTAWDACTLKEDRDAVFGKCCDLVGTWNDTTFEQEARAFTAPPRAYEHWRTSFGNFVKQTYRGAKDRGVRVNASVPQSTVYVQALLGEAATHAAVRSGQYFEFSSPLDKKDVAMDLVRRATARLVGEFVVEEENAPPARTVGALADALPLVDPDDSASQVDGRYRNTAPNADAARPPDAVSASEESAPEEGLDAQEERDATEAGSRAGAAQRSFVTATHKTVHVRGGRPTYEPDA